MRNARNNPIHTVYFGLIAIFCFLLLLMFLFLPGLNENNPNLFAKAGGQTRGWSVEREKNRETVFTTQTSNVAVKPEKREKRSKKDTLGEEQEKINVAKLRAKEVDKRERKEDTMQKFNLKESEVLDITSWREMGVYEFKFGGIASLPKTDSIIFQVIILGKKNWWSGTAYNDAEGMTEPLCKSAKHWNVGLITLLSHSGNLSTCESWYNGVVVHFDSLLTESVPLHDERLFVLEQFIRQYKLWKIYKLLSFFNFFYYHS